jgi:hypothetical protein
MDKGSKPNAPEKVNVYLKYSSLAFQLLFIVGGAYLVGKYIDQKIGWSFPVFTILLILLFFSAFLYKLYMELTKKES